MKKFHFQISLIIALISLNFIKTEDNSYPLIGILSVPSNGQEFPTNNTGIVNANYVRWLESNGMESIAIHPWYVPEELDSIIVKLNGIIIQGENAPMETTSAYYKTVHQIISRIKTFFKTDPNFNFPVFGIGQGFEILANVLEGENILESHENLNSQTKLDFDENEIVDTKMFHQMPQRLIDIFKNTNSLFDNHKNGVNRDKFTSSTSKIKEFMNIVALANDKNGKTYVACAEGIKDYPFFGVEFHPEIISFNRAEKLNVPDSHEAVLASRHFGHFLLKQVDDNKNTFPNYRQDKNYMTNKLPNLKDISDAYYYKFNELDSE